MHKIIKALFTGNCKGFRCSQYCFEGSSVTTDYASCFNASQFSANILVPLFFIVHTQRSYLSFRKPWQSLIVTDFT